MPDKAAVAFLGFTLAWGLKRLDSHHPGEILSERSTVPEALQEFRELTEVGRDLSAFRSGAAFASWMGLCPDNLISGGKILRAQTRHVNNHAATALRMAAQSLSRSHCWLGQTYRRLRPNWARPRLSPQPPTNWHESSITCSPPVRPTTKPSSHSRRGKLTTRRESSASRKLGFQLTEIPIAH